MSWNENNGQKIRKLLPQTHNDTDNDVSSRWSWSQTVLSTLLTELVTFAFATLVVDIRQLCDGEVDNANVNLEGDLPCMIIAIFKDIY